MHFARKQADPVPKYPAAGLEPAGKNDSALNCLQPDLRKDIERSSTPEHIRKFRKSTNGQPGVIVVHPGLREDAENLDRNRAYGKIVQPSDNVNVVIKA